MASPIDFFFKLGDYATGGDPERQQDFMYYMIWILFVAFFTMFTSNAYRLIMTGNIDFAIWTLVGFAITTLQFFTLKGLYEMRKLRKNPKQMPITKIDSMEDMIASFEKPIDNKKKSGGSTKNGKTT